MPRDSRTEYAVLGLLAQTPLTGYDIKKQVEQTLPHFWSESVGNIYPTLKRLHRDGRLDRSKQPQEGRPDRLVYSITPKGMESLTQWLASDLQPARPRSELALRVFLGRHGDDRDLIHLLHDYRARQKAAIERLRPVLAKIGEDHGSDPDRVYYELTVTLGLELYASLIRWCDTAITALDRKQQRQPGGTEGS